MFVWLRKLTSCKCWTIVPVCLNVKWITVIFSPSPNREITEAREITRKPVARSSLESAEYVKVITGLLNAKDFRDRINGIKQLLSDTENNQELVVANIVKVTVYKNILFRRPISFILILCGKSLDNKNVLVQRVSLLKILVCSFIMKIWQTGESQSKWGIGQAWLLIR